MSVPPPLALEGLELKTDLNPLILKWKSSLIKVSCNKINGGKAFLSAKLSIRFVKGVNLD